MITRFLLKVCGKSKANNISIDIKIRIIGIYLIEPLIFQYLVKPDDTRGKSRH